MPARAVALSLTSTKRDAPGVLERAGRPRAGRGSSRRAAGRAAPRRRTRPRAAPARARSRAAPRRATTTSSRSAQLERRARPGARPRSPSRIAAISAGVVPQQPPISRAPRSRACAANSAKYSGRRVRVDDAAAGQAREADVRQRRERAAVAAASARAPSSAARRPGAVVRADRREVELGQPLGGLARGHAGERLGALVEGQQRDDRQARDAAHRRDRVDELVEVVERLEHEQVGAAAFEDRRLLGEELGAHARASSPRRSARSRRR